MTYFSLVFAIATTRKMAHKCNYRLFTDKCTTTELSFNSSINTFASSSTTGMIVFMNLEVRLRLRATVAQSLIEAVRWENFCVQSYCFRRLMRNLLIKMEQFDWLNTIQSIHFVFVTDLCLT